MDTIISREESRSSGLVYDESYSGFFKDHDFNIEGGSVDHSIIDQSHVKSITVALDKGLDEVDDDDFPLSFSSRITLENLIYSEVLPKEETIEDPVKSRLYAVEKAGCKTWHGYIVNVTMSSSYQRALVEEHFPGAEKSAEDLFEYAAKTAQEVYSKLDAEKIRGLRRNLPRLYDALCVGIENTKQDIDSGKYNNEMKRLSGEEQSKRVQEIIELPIKTWLLTFEKELQSAGLDQCEKELCDQITNYCSSNGIKIVGSTFGNDFRKSVIMANVDWSA